MPIENFRDRDFSEYCEYVVAFKLQELGWKVFQPLSDRYIDIVAYKKIGGKDDFRTIQVKGSRIEKEGTQKTYGLTHKPKDLMHDSRHFFIWTVFDEKSKPRFIILSVSDFIKAQGKQFFKNESWRTGNQRLHFSIDLKNTPYAKFVDNWGNLINGGDSETYKLCIQMQEKESSWKSNSSDVIDQWNKNNKLEVDKETYLKIKRKTRVDLNAYINRKK